MQSIQEQVAKRAFELFEARGGQHGYHIQDWLQAEQEVSVPAPKKKRATAQVRQEPAARKAAVPRVKKPAVTRAKKAMATK